MLDFLVPPLVVGIITLGIYKLFELFARRRERLNIIDKISDRIAPEMLQKQLDMPSFRNVKFDFTSFSALKVGMLLLGIGLGMMVAFFITAFFEYNGGPALMSTGDYRIREVASTVYAASVLVFGGGGLVTAFLLELWLRRNKKVQEKEETPVQKPAAPRYEAPASRYEAPVRNPGKEAPASCENIPVNTPEKENPSNEA